MTILELGWIATPLSERPPVIPTIHPAYNNPSLPTYKVRNFLGGSPTHEVGPKKATIQIYKLLDLEVPPLHFPLGKDAIEGCLGQSKAYAEAAEKYASWSEDLIG